MTDATMFYGTRGPRNARILAVGESWGNEEARQQLPFVGSSGQELDRMLAEAGIDPASVLFTNIVAAQPPSNDMGMFFYSNEAVKIERPLAVRGLYPKPIVTDGLARLEKLIAEVKPDFIIGFGNYALWALTESAFHFGTAKSKVDGKTRKVPTGVTSFRGSQLYTRFARPTPFLPTYHPAAILRQWSWRPAAVHDLRKRYQVFREGRWAGPKYSFVTRPDFQTVLGFLEELRERLIHSDEMIPVAVDCETRAAHLACIGLATSSLNALCIPFMCVEDLAGYWTEPEELEIAVRLAEIFRHPKFFLIGQNFLYDAQYFARRLYCKMEMGYGKCHDTLVAQRLLFPGTPKGLDYLSSLFCDHHVYWKDDGKNWDPKVGEDQLWVYNCMDAVKTFEVAQAQQEVIRQQGLDDPWKWECEQLPLLLDMMLSGISIDLKARAGMTLELNDAIQFREAQLDYLVPWGKELRGKTSKANWYYSNKQLQQLFYEHFGMRVIKNRKTGQPTLDDAALILLARREPLLTPIVELLQELRSCKVFHSTFLQMKLDDDWRMRCSYNTHPETFRLSSSENAFGTGGNLQNIPKGNEDDDG